MMFSSIDYWRKMVLWETGRLQPGPEAQFRKTRLCGSQPCKLVPIDMRVRNLLILFLSATGAQAQQESHYALLASSAAKSIFAVQTAWSPTKADIANAEAGITQIAVLKAEGWSYAIHIEHPERYFRQYVPVRRAGKNVLYVNAFCDENPPAYWRKRLMIVADGATCYWQAFYDPATKTYSHLTINARA